MKIHKIRIHQEFNAPVEIIWESFNDHIKAGKMLGNKMERIVDSKDPNNVHGIGSVRRVYTIIGSLEETITKSEMYKCIEYTITKDGPFDEHYGAINFQQLPDGESAVHYTIDVGSKIPLWGRLLKTILSNQLTNGIKKYAERLK